MARKKHSAEQIVALLRQIEVELANHKSIGQACKEAGITEQTYFYSALDMLPMTNGFTVSRTGQTGVLWCRS